MKQITPPKKKYRLKILLRSIYCIKNSQIYSLLRIIFYKSLSKFPKYHAVYLFKSIFHKKINWENPRDLNEWIRWQLVFSDISIWSVLADKYKVRSTLKAKGLSKYLVKLYGVYDNAHQIAFDKLPNQFVLKLNHGCGDIIFCRNKEDKQEISSDTHLLDTLNKRMKQRYGLNTGELHYQNIEPKIIIEQLLPISRQDFASSSMIDYKFWCINGCVESCMVIFNRRKFNADIALFDPNWNNINSYLQSDTHMTVSNVNIPRPNKLTEMIELSEILSKDHAQVRVDLYYTNNHIFFGELTFTSLAGLMTYFTPEYLTILGTKIKNGGLALKK